MLVLFLRLIPCEAGRIIRLAVHNALRRTVQVYLTLADKAARELQKLREDLDALRKRAMAAEEAGGRSAKADLQRATNEAYLKTAELKVLQSRSLATFLHRELCAV